MNQDDLNALREWRDEAEGDDKRLLRKTLVALETRDKKISEARVLMKSAIRMLDSKGE